MREQSLPLTQVPDLLELWLAETFNSKEHGKLLKTIEQLPYPFNIVNFNSAAKEKQKPNPGKVFFMTPKEYKTLEKKIPKWKESWFILLEDRDVEDDNYLDVENLIILDEKTRDQIPHILELINERFCDVKKDQLINLAIKNSQILGKDSVKFVEDLNSNCKSGKGQLDQLSSLGLDVVSDLLEFYGDFFIVEDRGELEKLLKKVVSKSKIIKSVQIYEDLDDLIEDDKGGGMILPLMTPTKLALGLYKFPKNISPVAPFYTYYLNNLISISFKKLYPESETVENDLWEDAFSSIPFPCALVTDKGELVLHNSSFSKLSVSPAALAKLDDRKKVEAGNKIFELNRVEVSRNDQKQILLMLMSDNLKIEGGSGEKQGSSSEELGIISSSIAHELNNPLAGILATIAVLELEDEWLEDAEVAQGLKEMNQSAKRCKDLIEIFLGFSRAQPKKGETHEINELFSKSLELIRFRTIESNVRFEFDRVKKGGAFERELNTSVVSMMFYLILNEILTSFSHHKLVSREEDNVLKGSFNQYSNKVVIEMEKDFNFQKPIQSSKLIQHLIDLLGMSLLVEERKIILGEWTLT